MTKFSIVRQHLDVCIALLSWTCLNLIPLELSVFVLKLYMIYALAWRTLSLNQTIMLSSLLRLCADSRRESALALELVVVGEPQEPKESCDPGLESI